VSSQQQDQRQLQDPRPREQARSKRSLRLLAGGATLGAVLFAVVVQAISRVAHDHYSAIVYIVAAIIGGGVGMGLLPFLTLARQDGEDAAIVAARRPGPADAPIEGAEAIDEGRAVRSGGHHR
jgi:hypothetical protein